MAMTSNKVTGTNELWICYSVNLRLLAPLKFAN